MKALMSLACLGSLVQIPCCGSPPDAVTADRHVARPESGTAASSLLLELNPLRAESEAYVVSVISPEGWANPYVVGTEAIEQAIADSLGYRVLSPVGEPIGSPNDGVLSGKVRHECGDLFAALSVRSNAEGFAISGAHHEPQPRAVEVLGVRPEHEKAVVELLTSHGVPVERSVIEKAYRIDLDGDGSSEVVLQATHPDLLEDFQAEEVGHYSVLVIVPVAGGASPFSIGYTVSDSENTGFEVVSLDTVADLDADGSMELIVQARHYEGWQTQIYGYDNGVAELFRTVSGERDCAALGN